MEEEPLLVRRSSLYKILEDVSISAGVEDQEAQLNRRRATPSPASPAALIKDRLIYGPDSSPGAFAWFDYALKKSVFDEEIPAEALSPHRGRGRGSSSRTIGDCVCPCTCVDSVADGFVSESDNSVFDDSFLDTIVVGGHGSGHQTYLADLSRMDLLDIRSPKARDSDVRRETWSSAAAIPVSASTETPVSAAAAAAQHYVSGPAHIKKQLHRSRTAPAMAVMADLGKPHAKQDSPSSSSPLISQAFICLIAYLAVGVAIYMWREDDFSGTSTNSFVDAIYFCIVTMCTIGYGDITPATSLSKLFACAFVLVGFGLIDILLTGVVNYILDRQEEELLNSVLYTGQYRAARNYLVDVKKGRMRIRLKVVIAFVAVTMCIGVGTLFMHFTENLGWLDSFYLSCMSVTTVGYGDHAFKTTTGRIFASIWLLVSTLAVARSFLYLAEARIEKRHRLLARRVLEKDMTFGDLVAADLDNDGHVSKSDFVVYKLKQMGKIEDKDIREVCQQFSRLDTDNSGKITLSCFLDLHTAPSST